MTKITIKSNSAIMVEGEFQIVDSEGNKYNLNGREKVSLCRCGLSKIKPFCDGAHKGNFESEAIAFNWEKKV
jgi:CDGSH-type Zn-finger protein